jgi:flagellar protein FlaI
MQTGHPVLSTFHASSVERVVQRLTGDPIKIPKSFMDNLNFIVIQSAVWRGGVLVRRVISVNEIVGYDPKSDAVVYVPVFTWDPVKDVFVFRGRGASYLLENKIAVMRGISRINMKAIYEELEQRAYFLKLLFEKKVFNYYDVWNAIVKTYELGLDTAIKKLERGSLL